MSVLDMMLLGPARAVRAAASIPRQALEALVPEDVRTAFADEAVGDTTRPAQTRDSVLALAATGAGLALSTVGGLLSRAPLPTELASLVTAVDHHPRLRGLLENTVGQRNADLGLTALSALGQGLAGGRLGLLVDTTNALLSLAEQRAAGAGVADDLAERADTLHAAAEEVRRPVPLPPGPVERYTDLAGVAAIGGFGLGALPLAGGSRRALALALAATPKAAGLGRETFAAGLTRLLCRRGVTVLEPSILRRLDVVDTVVLDSAVLRTGRMMLDDVQLSGDVDGTGPAEVATALYELFRADRPTAVGERGDWRLRPLDRRERSELSGHPDSRRVARAAVRHVLELSRGGRRVALAGVVDEPSDSAATLVAATRDAGLRLLVAGAERLDGTTPDGLLPDGPDLPAAIRQEQAGDAVVLAISTRADVLRQADVGIAVSAGPDDGDVPTGGQLVIGADLGLAALVIEACAPSAAASRRAVRLAQLGSALGGVAALLDRGGTFGPGPCQAAMLGVNAAAAASIAQGEWLARKLDKPVHPTAAPRCPWHLMPAEAVLAELGSHHDGLSDAAAGERRPETRGRSRPTLLGSMLTELNNPLTPILVGGAALSAAVGSLTDAGMVAGVTALSALVGGAQRLRTERAVTELVDSSRVLARVRRDGRTVELPASDVVVGDVIVLRDGDVVPADCRLLEATGLQVDEAALTGEPFPVAKQTEPVISSHIGERASMAYEGTSVSAGRGLGVVVATGASTEVGRSMATAAKNAPDAGVESRLEALTARTLPVALGSAAAVVGAGLLHRRPLRESLGAGVSLAVASVPEGLPFLVQAAQLASAKRLSQQGTLVRNPRTIEALGRVDTLCFDKTGTLTEGRIVLAAVDDTAHTVELAELGDGADPRRDVLAAGLRATPRGRGGGQLTHLTDRAITEGAKDAEVTREHGASGWRRLATLPFDPSRGFHASLAAVDGSPTAAAEAAVLSVKGAPETLLRRCSRVRRGGKESTLDGRHRRKLRSRANALAGRGYRVLAVAERADRRRRGLADEDVQDLTLLGFLALSDPVRPAAAPAVSSLRDAGVQIVMITGDHPGTATAVAERLDTAGDGRVITGPELDEMTDDELDELLPSVAVVARGTPTHKVRVVEGFQRLGRTVAMTGDGANDAAAIRLADVGIALGSRATPAARATADLVVTDDRLETILAAMAEGRGMWASVRKALGILVGGNLGEIAFTVLGAGLSGRSPLTARQLLLVNLLTDLAPALAVALRPPEQAGGADLLAEGPEASLGAALTGDITRRAVTTATATSGAWLAARYTGRARRASTVALATLVGSQLGQTVAVGGTSPSVLISGLGSAALLAAIVQTPGISQFFGCTPLGPVAWGIAGTAVTAATASALLQPLLSPDGPDDVS